MNETKYLREIKHYYTLSSNILSVDKLEICGPDLVVDPVLYVRKLFAHRV
jgi:hypothetical protein